MRNCHRIAFLTGPEGHEDSHWREAGYCEARAAQADPFERILVALVGIDNAFLPRYLILSFMYNELQDAVRRRKMIVQFEMRQGVPQCALEDYERDLADRHLLNRVVARWAKEKPGAVAIINADTKQEITWETFDRITTDLAMKLLHMVFQKGDYFATYVRLHDMAQKEVGELRARGDWDR